MSATIDHSLRKILRGGVLVFIGTAAGMLFSLVNRAMVARFGQEDFGVYSLSLAIVSIAGIASLLGIHMGLPRQIAFYRGKDDTSKIRELCFSSLLISLITSMTLSVIIITGAKYISTNILQTPQLEIALKIMGIAIPFHVLIQIFSSAFRGFEKAKPNVFFQNLMRNGIFTLLLFTIIIFKLSFLIALFAYVISEIVTFLVFMIYTRFHLPLSFQGCVFSLTNSTRILVTFSLPLLVVTMFQNVTIWTDTIMLGYYLEPDRVGLYNAASTLALVINLGVTAIPFLALPLMSQLYAKGQIEEIRRIYASIAKWIFAITLPVFLIFILFPGATLRIIFGSQYASAAVPLIFLTIGFFINAILGPNGAAMVVIGQTKYHMFTIIVASAINVVLNVVLIPIMGINGAAIATMSTLTIRNLLLSSRLYSLNRINPFTRNYLKPALLSIALAFGIQFLVRNVIGLASIWLLVLFFLLFVSLYALCVLITRSFDREDVMILLAIEKKLGFNLQPLKDILKRFI